MNAKDFEKLEQANAQIDVWIDEEDYGAIGKACDVQSFCGYCLSKAFKDPNCTKTDDEIWLTITNDDGMPIKAIKNIPNLEEIELTADDCLHKYWSQFFWAKLIRAKIQEKGTDCFFRRLDQVLTFLERHIPIISKIGKDEDTLLYKQLTVIFLLEMAAAGEGVDQRSFAIRARRLLNDRKSGFKKEFKDFYDLLARYNIGTGHFHEANYREALREFNYIIYKWENNNNFKPFAEIRKGEEFIRIPSAIYRADIQLKLQLAYHAHNTINDINKLDDKLSIYKKSKKHLILTEAYQQMDRLDKFRKELAEVSPRAAPKVENGDLKKIIKLTDKECQFANIRGKLQSLLADWYLQYLKEYLKEEKHYDCNKKLREPEIRDHLSGLNEFFCNYKFSTKYNEFDSRGYWEQIAEYVAWLSENGLARAELKGILREEIKKIYLGDGTNANNGIRGGLIEKEQENEEENHSCPCEKEGIDLRQIGEEHYNDFTNNIWSFFNKSAAIFKNDTNNADLFSVLRKDKKIFLKRLLTLEESRSNLEHRKRKIYLEDANPKKWGDDKCLPSGFEDCKTDNGGNHCFFKFKDSSQTKNHRYESLTAKDYQNIMNHWDDRHFLKYLKNPSYHPSSKQASFSKQAFHFLGLQRWNSSSPAQGRSLGGGYLLYHMNEGGFVDLGIAIDPGFDFIRNLFHAGFSLADIDVVLISHAHLDHIRDFESIITLLLELQSRVKNRNGENNQRKLHVILTLGGYRRLEYIFESFTLHRFVEPYIIDIEKEIKEKQFWDSLKLNPFKFIQEKKTEEKAEQEKNEQRKNKRLRFEPNFGENDNDDRLRMEIIPTKAYHNDYTEYSDSFGFLIQINGKDIIHTFGYTGDTSWCCDVIEQYKKCNTLLVHLGSLIERKDTEKRVFDYYKNGKRCFELIRKANHPYLMGMLHFLSEIAEFTAKPLILLSEFGEELRGRIRLDLVERMKCVYKNDEILPVDVGLDVLLAEQIPEKYQSVEEKQNKFPRVLCVQCEEFVCLTDVDFEYYGHDEALFCVCRTCAKSTSSDVLQSRLRLLYEEGRPLQTY